LKVYLSLGAGVQSSTLALMAAAGEVTPMPDGAIFADTQAEPASVYRWLDYLESVLPFPVHRVTAGSLTESALKPRTSKKGIIYFKTAIPFFTIDSKGKRGRIGQRTCTRDYKIQPIIRHVRGLVGWEAMRGWRAKHRASLREWLAFRENQKAIARAEREKKRPPEEVPFPHLAWAAMQSDALTEQWIGISTDEWTRAKPSRDPWIRTRHPLIERRMTRAACLEWMRSRGFPEPPRSACWFCPFRGNNEWRWLRDNEPENFARAVEFDRQARELRQSGVASNQSKSMVYLHRDCVPLGDVDLRTGPQKGQLEFAWQGECEGMCGV